MDSIAFVSSCADTEYRVDLVSLLLSQRVHFDKLTSLRKDSNISFIMLILEDCQSQLTSQASIAKKFS